MSYSSSHVYDNWGSLVAAVVRREENWQLCLADSRSPSLTSSSSDLTDPIDLSAIDQLLEQQAPQAGRSEPSSSANNHFDHVLKPPKTPTAAQIGKLVGAALRFVIPARKRPQSLLMNPPQGPQSQMENPPQDTIVTEKFESSDAEKESARDGGQGLNGTRTFTFRELATATKNFQADCLLGGRPSGMVYRGRLGSTNQIVAIKQIDMRSDMLGNRGFLVEILMLGLLHHPNLINLIGYCADGDQRLSVYEYMPLGSLEQHLHDLPPDKEPLDWSTRIKIAAGTAKGLEYLHNGANPPVIHRNIKSSNILLDNGYHPKLSDFGLAKLGPVGDKEYVSTRVMGTYGYCAPEYAMTGQLTLKADVYSFGVLLLEIISGRKAIDNSRPVGEHSVVAWARPLFKDRRRFPQMADPTLQGQYPVRSLYQALAVAAMCVQKQPNARPAMADVTTALTYLATQKYDPQI